jgi:formiminotetrahydrofolate cyclodeaminase
MIYTKKSCEEFVEMLAGRDPVPGGGGASALVAAVGIALGNMVGSLTIGKKKYEDVQKEVTVLKEKALILQRDLLSLVQKDARVFAPWQRPTECRKLTKKKKQKKEK